MHRAGLYKSSLDSTLRVTLGLAMALEHAHENGVVHRDVKPANVIFDREDHECVLTDFGICLIRDFARPTVGAEVLGPFAFMAPELEEGGRLDVTTAADTYSLGKVIYFMLSGGVTLPRERHREPQFDIFSNKGMRYELLAHLLDRMICPVERRIGSMTEVIKEVERIQKWDQESGTVLPTGAQAILQRFVSQQREAASIEERNKIIQEKRNALFTGYAQSIGDWLDQQMISLAKALSHSGILQVRVLDKKECAAAVGSTQVIQLKPVSGLRPQLVRGLVLVSSRDPFKASHLLRFTIFTEEHIRVTVGYTPQEIKEDEIVVWLVPSFFENSTMQGFFVRKDLVESFDCQVTNTFYGEKQSIALRSVTSAWPSAIAEYKETLNQAVESFVGFMEKKFTGLFYGIGR